MRSNEATWPFENDADRGDPLTALRIAVTSSHPRWSYLVAFDRDSAARPTDAEARMLASFLDEYKHHWYRESYLVKLAERPLDVDGGANGVVFHKFGDDDWGYRRHSFVQGWPWSVVWPSLRQREPDSPLKGPFTLVEVMDRAQGHGAEPPPRWVEWKAAHPEAFGQVTTVTRPSLSNRVECPSCKRLVPVVDGQLAGHLRHPSTPSENCDGPELWTTAPYSGVDHG